MLLSDRGLGTRSPGAALMHRFIVYSIYKRHHCPSVYTTQTHIHYKFDLTSGLAVNEGLTLCDGYMVKKENCSLPKNKLNMLMM